MDEIDISLHKLGRSSKRDHNLLIPTSTIAALRYACHLQPKAIAEVPSECIIVGQARANELSWSDDEYAFHLGHAKARAGHFD